MLSQRTRRLPLLWAWLIALLLAACATVPGGGPTPAAPTEALPTSAPKSTQPAAPTEPAPTEPILSPTEAPTEAPTAAPTEPIAGEGVLPAPLYFLSGPDDQIWRVERDGTTITQITREPAPVTYFDVSPVDGSLAYVSGNALLRAAADGSGRTVLLAGPEVNEEDRISTEVVYPYWSPDGTQIAFGLGGVRIIAASGGEAHLLIPSDPLPDLNSGARPPADTRFYRRGLWSPDGTQLLVEYFFYPEGGSWGMLRLNSDAGLVEFGSPEGILCCNPSWSQDSQYVYFSNDTVGLVVPGLWRVPAATGATETLIDGTEGNPGQETFHLFSHARQLSDGNLYYFYTTTTDFPEGWPHALTPYRAAADGQNAAALREDAHNVGAALWAPDASGAVVMQLEPNAPWPFRGRLLWLDTAGNPALNLGVEGFQMNWGK